MIDEITAIRGRAEAFSRAAHDLFASFEASPSRVVSLNETRKQLTILSLRQNELLEESLRAIEARLYRAAIVLAWAAFIDFLERKLDADGLLAVHAKRPAWAKLKTVDQLKEQVPEHQLVDVAREVGLLNKAEMKVLLGLLSKRNECAHPTGYRPGLNEALGFVSELLNRLTQIDQRAPSA